MSRVHTLWFVVMSVVLMSTTAYAQEEKKEEDSGGIDIEIRGGAKRVLTSLAVPDTLPGNPASAAIARRVQDALRRDLELAGFFKLIPPGSLFFDPAKEGMDKVNFPNWEKVAAQGLVKTKATISGGKVTLDMRLYIVPKGKQARLKFQASPVTQDGYEKVVHEFANAVVGFYTGTPGIFGSQIAYVRRNKAGLKQIYAMDMSGKGRRKVTSNSSINLLPTWGGGRIFYTSYLHQNPDLWVYEGGKHRKLSSQRGQNSGAAYCGGKLAVTLSMGGENTDIYLIDPKTGRKLQRLTDHWDIDTSPTWNSNCTKIAFVSGRASSPQIYVMNADGSNQRRLTLKGTYNTQPEWSPKGNKIVFSSRDERNAYDIFTVDLEGNIERLTQNQGNNEDPSFSPDGRYIVFTSDRGVKGRRKRIWLMTSDGQYQRLLTERGSGYESPAWAK